MTTQILTEAYVQDGDPKNTAPIGSLKIWSSNQSEFDSDYKQARAEGWKPFDHPSDLATSALIDGVSVQYLTKGQG